MTVADPHNIREPAPGSHPDAAPLFAFDSSRNWKKAGTSSDAAQQAKPTSAYWRSKCLEVLRTGDFTADEIAGILDASILTIRPRCSELTRAGVIRPSGLRRANKVSGRSADVLTLRPAQAEAAAA